jgi:hypothetical protein
MSSDSTSEYAGVRQWGMDSKHQLGSLGPHMHGARHSVAHLLRLSPRRHQLGLNPCLPQRACETPLFPVFQISPFPLDG